MQEFRPVSYRRSYKILWLHAKSLEFNTGSTKQKKTPQSVCLFSSLQEIYGFIDLQRAKRREKKKVRAAAPVVRGAAPNAEDASRLINHRTCDLSEKVFTERLTDVSDDSREPALTRVPERVARGTTGGFLLLLFRSDKRLLEAAGKAAASKPVISGGL